MENLLIVTLFGATGDLALRKLLPALSNLVADNAFASDFKVLAVGRRPFTREEYLTYVKESNAFSGRLTALAPYLDYVNVDISTKQSFATLAEVIATQSSGYKRVKQIFYFAVSPDLFVPIAVGLSAFNIAKRGSEDVVLALEKPFGLNFNDALQINDELMKHFDEKQIYRVDHYLGKEMIQNLLTLRFANIKYATLWHRDYISEVKIVVSEKDGILNRGPYYDNVGVLNDMVQSHLLQILALLAMETPASLESESITAAKLAVLDQLRVDNAKTVLGQYKTYKNERGVAPNSQTPTLAFLTLFVNSARFKDVPFYIFTGKKLAQKEAYIEIIFKKPESHVLFDEEVSANTLRIYLAPEAKIVHTLNGKKPGYEQAIEQTAFEYCYTCTFPNNVKEAYEKLFLEMILTNKSLFPDWREIKEAWSIVRTVKKSELFIYDDGFALEETR